MLFFHSEKLIYNGVVDMDEFWKCSGMYLSTTCTVIASLPVLQFSVASNNMHINLEKQLLDLFFLYYVAFKKKSMEFVFPSFNLWINYINNNH